MQPTAIPLGALLALLSFSPAPVLRGPSPQEAPVPRGGALTRVMPEPADEEPGEGLFARDFDAQRWRTRLGSSDLDRRERTYAALLQRAGFDPAARLFLEDLAADASAGELAWTARLALRELGRSPFGGQHLPGNVLGGANPLQSLMQDFFARGQSFSFPRSFGAPDPFETPGSVGPLQGSTSGHSIRLQQENGRLRLEVVETVDGQEKRTVYEGANLDEILAQDPGLAKELGRMRFRVGTPFELPALPQRPPEPVTTDKLGIIARPLTPEHARELGLESQGLFVERSAVGTYAYLLGIGEGDVLVELNGEPVRTVDDVGRLMAAHHPNTPLRAAWIDELGQRRSKSWPAEGKGHKH